MPPHLCKYSDNIKYKKISYPSQKNYENIIKQLNIYSLKCSCEARGQFIIHAYYTRYIKAPFGKVKLRILQVRCKSCGKTHAILLDSIVPYSQITMGDHINIIKAMEEENNPKQIMNNCPEIEEANITYIQNKYRVHWKERLRSISLQILPLLKDAESLIISAFDHFQINFMQIRCTYNSLQSINHIG